MKLVDDNGTVQIDEHELHDIVASMREGLIRHEAGCPEDIKNGMVVLQAFRIVPKEPDLFTPELVKKWESGMNALLEHLGGIDCTYHDDAEYTC